MISTARSALAIASALLTLAACATPSGIVVSQRELPPIPADIRVCFRGLAVPAPPDGPLNRKAAARLIADLYDAGVDKTLCGQRFIAWYDDLVRGFTKSQ